MSHLHPSNRVEERPRSGAWCSVGRACALASVIAACADGRVNEGAGAQSDGITAGSHAGSAGGRADPAGAAASGGGAGASGTGTGTGAGVGAGAGAGAGGMASNVGGGNAGAGGQGEDAGSDAGSGDHTPVGSGCDEVVADAPAAAWSNATGSLAGMASECGNLTLVAADPCSDRVIAGVAKGGLYATSDRGGSWTKLGSGAGSASIAHRPSSIVFDPQHAEVFYESGIYGSFGDGVYKTEDGGTTFTQLGTIGHIDLVSVDFGDPERKTLLAGVHETKRKLFLSSDAGESWTDIGGKLPESSHFSSAPLVLDARHFLLGACGWGDGTCGVFASEDAGESWTSASGESPAGQPLWMADGHLVWPTIYGSGALLSDDSGQSWTKVEGPRAGSPIELPDGRIVAVGGDHLILSTDAGRTWNNIGEPLPYPPAGVTYSRSQKTFFIWHWDCGDAVLSDAIMSAGLQE